MRWLPEEVDLLNKHLHRKIYDIYFFYQKKFSTDRRSYDSVQKKVLQLREATEKIEPKKEDNHLTLEQQETIDIYVDALQQLGRKPSTTELEEYGITRSALRHRFGNYKKLEKAVRETHQELFKEIGLSDLLTAENKRSLLSAVKDTSRFVITTAVMGCRVDRNFFNAINNYCREHNAKLIIMIAADPAHQWAHDDELGYVDEILDGQYIVIDEVALNNNLYLSSIKLSAKQIDPVTGMQQLAQQDGSYIFASPKQRLQFVPVPMHKHPPAIMGTGAITMPDYRTDMYMSRRTAYLAERSHVMGAIIVEIEDDEVFHFRQVQAESNGSFIDWGVQYYPDGSTEEVILEAVICGDEHAGAQNPVILAARKDLCEELEPIRIVLHDIFDGKSISHHVEGKAITKAQRATAGLSNLKTELKAVGKALMFYKNLCEKVVVVKSNHDEHLVKYLEDSRFIYDSHNYRLALDLAAAVYDKKDPIQVGVELVTQQSFDFTEWLKRDQEYVVANVELGHHGDKGPNGARGSIKNFANSIRKSVTGHTHSAEIYNNAWRVGTSTGHLDYCSGTSSWTNTDCLLYSNGSMQLVNYINGKYKI